MNSDFFDYVGASAVATVLTFYGWFIVLSLSAARGERAGYFSALGLVLGLVVFGAFPIANILLNLVQMTQYYQYVRFVVVALALISAVVMYLNFRQKTVEKPPSGWVLFGLFLLGFFIHLITPLPYDFYEKLLTHGAWKEVAGNIVAQFTGIENPFSNPLRSFTLPIVAFMVYVGFALIGNWIHRPVVENNVLRLIMMISSILVFVGVAIWVAYHSVVYDLTLFDKATNFGLRIFLQN